MPLSYISLRNIRKHTETKIEFSDTLNYIVGGNGVGKTTILEAIHYLCTTKSCVTSSDAEAVRFGEYSFIIEGNFTGRTEDKIKVTYSIAENKKYYMLSNKQINRFSDIIGIHPAVLLSPADHSITQGYSADRRKFVDSVISQSSRTYLNLLIEYNRTLKQRAVLLNRIKESRKNDFSELTAWNEKLVSTGIEIIKQRKEFVKDFELYVKESYQRILFNKELPEIKYFFLDGKCSEVEEVFFFDRLNQFRAEEIRRATNLVGPHKDDFIFDINGLSLRSYGSQGQHKTFQTILRFAEYFYLKDKTGKMPLFLLDDVFGELDAERASAISNYLEDVGQAFVTLTDFGNFSFLNMRQGYRIIRLSENGKVVYA